MLRKVGEGFGKLLYSPTLETLVVSCHTDVHWDIFAETFGKLTAGILSCFSKELLVFQLIAFSLDKVQGILEGYLLIRSCADIARHGVLHGLEIEEIQRVRKLREEITYTNAVDIVPAVVKREVHLHYLLPICDRVEIPHLLV